MLMQQPTPERDHLARWTRAQRIAARVLPRHPRSTDAFEDKDDWISQAYMNTTRAIESSPLCRTMSDRDREAWWDLYFARACKGAFLSNLRKAQRHRQAIPGYIQLDRLRREQRAWRQATHPERAEELEKVLGELPDMDRAMLLEQLRGTKLADRAGRWGRSIASMSKYAQSARDAAHEIMLERLNDASARRGPVAVKSDRRPSLGDG